MAFLKKFYTALAVFLSLAASAAAAVPEKEWRDLSDRDVSPQGKAALSIRPGSWKHAETAHFVYHYISAKEAETVTVHSEVYYAWIKEVFGVSEDAWTKKVHVFVFDEKEDWSEFIGRVGMGLHPEAFTTGWELFLYRDPYWLAPQKTLAHELTHVIAFRFLEGPIPVFLNEGFAEFIAYRAVARQAGGNEYDLRTVQLVKPADWIPLKELAAARDYPREEEKIRTFYRESELLVRYLILKEPPATRFYALLREVSRGVPFEKALRSAYGHSPAEFEEKLKAFATSKG